MLRKLAKSIRANTLVGFFLIVPVVATILIFNFLFKLATNWLPQGAFPKLKTIWHGYPLRILTLLAIIVVFYFVGLLTRNILVRRLYQIGDKLLTRTPFIKGIYVSVRQISESLFTQRKTLFKEVVLVQYPRKGLYSIAFVTSRLPPSIARKVMGTSTSVSNFPTAAEKSTHSVEGNSEEVISLFIPTTPNPTSGGLIVVPRSEVIPLKMPVTDALTFIMSAGAVAPGEHADMRPTLLDKLEAWLKHDDDSTEKIDAAPTSI